MKIRKVFFTTLIIFLLTSCSLFPSRSSSDPTTSSSTTTESDTSSDSNTNITSDPSSDDATTGDDVRPTSGQEIVDFYAVNDLHGAIVETTQGGGEPGFAKMATYFKDKKNENPEHSVVLSIGDMWQGTYEVYHSKGEVVTEAMNNIGFDAMTIGNHEFDWGPSYILENAQKANFPFLGANIMEYPNTNIKSEIGEEYVILQKGHLKIGVIGTIGQDQMTSICSRLIEDIYFSDPTPIIKSLSQKLKNEHGVDIVVLATHTGQEDIDPSIPAGGYVDAIFNAHTHRHETQVINGVPFIQGGSRGRYLSHLQFSFDYATNHLTTLEHEVHKVEELNLDDDIDVKNIIDHYVGLSAIDGDEHVGYAVGNFENDWHLPCLVNYIAAEKTIEQGHTDLDLAMVNNARATISEGSLTYGDLYRGLPFDNLFYIVWARGSDLIFEAQYNKVYRVRDYDEIDETQYYKTVVPDHTLLHQDENKQYNYFSHYNPAEDFIDILADDDGQYLYPRDLVKLLLANEPNNTINYDDPRFVGDRHGSSLTT